MAQETPRIINLNDYYETLVQCCAELGWSMPGLYRRIQKGEVATIKIGRTRLIKRRPNVAA